MGDLLGVVSPWGENPLPVARQAPRILPSSPLLFSLLLVMLAPHVQGPLFLCRRRGHFLLLTIA